MKRVILFMLFVFFSFSYKAFAQGSYISGPEVNQCVRHDTSPPLRNIPESPITHSNRLDRIVPLNIIPARFEDQFEPDPVLQETMGKRSTDFVFQSWDGVAANNGFEVPDANGDVGPNHYMQATNVQFQIWNKTGTSLLGPLNLGTIWAGFPGPWSTSLNAGDPIVLYDEAADRWFIAQMSLPNYPSGPFYIITAVSQTEDPTGSWHRYGFSFTNWPDYPKFGIWPDGYYMSANTITPAGYFDGTYVAVFERSQMLTGGVAQSVSFTSSGATTWSFLPSDWNGTTTPPTGSPNYFLQIHDNTWYGGTDGVDIYSFSVNWTSPANSTFTGPAFVGTSDFTLLPHSTPTVPQQGTNTLLEHLGENRAMNRLDYRNFGTHQSMVVCHTVDAGSARAGIRWFEFRKPEATWTLHQEGTYAPVDGLHRWMGSIAINAAGSMALGYSVSNASMYPAIRFTGRNATDSAGQMTIPEETIFEGTGAQESDRWGDYTQMVVDPNEINFWYVNQYQPSTSSFNWRTRIANIDYTIPVGVEVELPLIYTLRQNYPNPFNPITKISWQLPVSSHQTLKVYDVLGNEVATLVDENKEAGRYEVEFNASLFSSGIYFYRLQAGNYTETKKMILMR